MKIRRIVFLCFVLLPIFAFSQELGTLNLDPLHLQLPATWTFDASKRPIEGHGPDGETLLITIAKNVPIPRPERCPVPKKRHRVLRTE